MKKSLHKVLINRTNTITLVFVERDGCGSIRSRQRITLNRRAFEMALRRADITVPWSAVNHP